MTAHVTPIADANVNSTAIARNPNKPSNVCVGSRLRIRRTSRGISQQELSKRLRIDCDDLTAYEEGTERINANLLLRIAKLMDIRPDYFFRNYTEEELEGCLLSRL
jgi:transcriptional regulator with XRE-family HTH domain